jgi:hypothetical protein
VLADKGFDRLIAVVWGPDGPKATDLVPFSAAALNAALDCRQRP